MAEGRGVPIARARAYIGAYAVTIANQSFGQFNLITYKFNRTEATITAYASNVPTNFVIGRCFIIERGNIRHWVTARRFSI